MTTETQEQMQMTTKTEKQYIVLKIESDRYITHVTINHSDDDTNRIMRSFVNVFEHLEPPGEPYIETHLEFITNRAKKTLIRKNSVRVFEFKWLPGRMYEHSDDPAYFLVRGIYNVDPKLFYFGLEFNEPINWFGFIGLKGKIRYQRNFNIHHGVTPLDVHLISLVSSTVKFAHKIIALYNWDKYYRYKIVFGDGQYVIDFKYDYNLNFSNEYDRIVNENKQESQEAQSQGG